MYCVEEIYQYFFPGDLGPMYSQKPDYSTQFEKLEDAENFCDNYNREYENTLNEWPKLRPHLMTEGDMKAWKEQQEYEYEMYDR